MSSDNTGVQSRLDALKAGAGSAGTSFQKAVQTEAAGKSKDRGQIRNVREAEAGLKSNPFFQILTKADYSNEEKVAMIRKVLTFNRDESKEENRERITLMNRLEEFLELQRRGHATQLIDLNGSDVYPQLKNTMGQILDEFNKFQQDLSTITEPLKTIEEIRSKEGKERVLEALKNANESKKLGEELNGKIEALNAESIALTASKDGAEATAVQLEKTQKVEESKKLRNFMSKMVGGKSHVAMVEREQEIADNKARAAELSANLDEKRTALTEQLTHLAELEKILEADPNQKRVQDLIDIGTASYQKRIDELRDAAKAFINFTAENMEACVERLKISGEHIESLETANETYTQYYGLLAQGNKEAMGDNVVMEDGLRKELTELEAANADDPAVQIKTMEVKQLTANVNDFVTKQQVVSETHAIVRNNLAEQSTAIIALKRSNTIAQQKAYINLNNGVSTAATHFATVITALNSASTAEASEQIGGTFDAVRSMTQDTLETVLGRLVDDISSGRAQIAEQSDGIRKLAGTLSNVREGLLNGIRDTLTTLDDAEASNRELAEVAKRTRAVETDAHRDHDAGVVTPAAERKSGVADRFGLGLK